MAVTSDANIGQGLDSRLYKVSWRLGEWAGGQSSSLDPKSRQDTMRTVTSVLHFTHLYLR